MVVSIPAPSHGKGMIISLNLNWIQFWAAIRAVGNSYQQRISFMVTSDMFIRGPLKHQRSNISQSNDQMQFHMQQGFLPEWPRTFSTQISPETLASSRSSLKQLSITLRLIGKNTGDRNSFVFNTHAAHSDTLGQLNFALFLKMYFYLMYTCKPSVHIHVSYPCMMPSEARREHRSVREDSPPAPGVGTGHTQTLSSQHKEDLLPRRGRVGGGEESAKTDSKKQQQNTSRLFFFFFQE